MGVDEQPGEQLASQSSETLLVMVPEVQLHEVNNGKEALLEWGELTVSIHAVEGVSGVWLKVGKTEWSIDAGAPTLKAGEHTYMFAMGTGRFYSLLLAQGSPPDAVALLEGVLQECSSFEEQGGRMDAAATEAAVAEVAQEIVDLDDLPLQLQRPQARPGVKPTASERITGGAAVVQEKVMQGAAWTSQKLLEGSRAMQARTEPAQGPSRVSPEMAARVKLARRAAEKSSRVANRVAGGIADISVRLADSIVARVGPSSKVGEQLQAEQPAARRGAAREIASAALLAAVGVYDSMEQAAALVAASGGRATHEFIGHKYGPEAGAVAEDATHATYNAGKAALAVKQVQKLGVKKVAKRIAKRTAVGLVKSYAGHPPAQQGGQALPAASGSTAGSGYYAAGSPHGAAPAQHSSHAARAAGAQPLQGSMPAPGDYESPFANK